MILQIIGGTFSNITLGEESSVVNKLRTALLKHGDNSSLKNPEGMFSGSTLINGGNLNFLRRIPELLGDVTLWMPDIDNEMEKIYPVKKRSSILICSKVLREGRDLSDAVGRIFKMHGNAVIAITPVKDSKFSFTLLDALGNIWSDTDNIDQLAKDIIKFLDWMQEVERVGSVCEHGEINVVSPYDQYQKLKVFCDINTKVADKVENCNDTRYFGNCSTRCSQLFPTLRTDVHSRIHVSRRNSNKLRLTPTDMLVAEVLDDKGTVKYYGNTEVKPSVDTPVQLQLYKLFPEINYMIHGHAYVDEAPFTEEYYPCGDLREVWGALRQIKDVGCGAVNLKNHGFLIYAKTIGALQNFIDEKLSFKSKPIGEKI
jgi:hypothetical protein